MATKGASNRYGNSNGAGGKGKPTSNINYAWAKDFGKGLVDSHYEKHSKEFGSISKKQYISDAIHFANTVDRKNYASVVDKRGTTYKWDTRNGKMVEVNKNGIIVSYRHTGGNLWYINKKGEKTWIKTIK